MTTPFDAIAPDYDTLWSSTEHGWQQRTEVLLQLDALFRRGDSILDLGCGTGDDAVHLRAAGVRVMAIDSSNAMVEIARSRGVDAHWTPIEQLCELDGRFDGGMSNFGALNCIRDLAPVARELGRLVRPGGPLALCFVSRFWWEETLSFLGRMQFRKAVRRWNGHARWRGLDVYYPPAIRIRRTFAPWFHFRRSVPIGGGDHTLYIFERRASC